MKSNYKKLGSYIRQIDVRNVEDKKDNLLGVSTKKIFIESIANTIGTNFKKYKIVKRHQFTYVPDTSRRGDKIGIAMLQSHDTALVSQVYTVFEIIDTKKLFPEYLMMWFRRPEFDRYARYMSHGSVREIFDWDEMCNIELPVPSPERQREIIEKYNIIVNRIKLNEQINEKLEETAQTIYKQWFVDFEFPISQEYATSVRKPELEGRPYKSNGGEMIYNKELDQDIPMGWEVYSLVDLCQIKGGKRLPAGESLISERNEHPYIKIADLGKFKYSVLSQGYEYLNPDLQKQISRYIVSSGDIVISIVGTIGIARIIHSSLDGANLTENCVRLTHFDKITADYIYHYLYSICGQNELISKVVGGVQGKLPIYNIESFRITCPDCLTMNSFTLSIEALNAMIQVKLEENIYLNDMKDIPVTKSLKMVVG